jgi:hypothetical protein
MSELSRGGQEDGMRYGFPGERALGEKLEALEKRVRVLEAGLCPICGSPKNGHGTRPTPIGPHDLDGDPHVVVGETHEAPPD